jgi:hypothetical protein
MTMGGLTLFGLIAVTAMLLCYAFEKRSHWYILGFSLSCLLGSIYGLECGRKMGVKQREEATVVC